MAEVKGEGPIPCGVMLIGERPGRQEARSGRPFCGPAGQELNRYLSVNSGLRREDCYVTNLVKTYSDDPPTAEEISRDWGVLMEELEAVQPRYIGLVGEHSSRAILTVDDFEMGWAHGLAFQAHPMSLPTELAAMPLWHPAAGLHQPSIAGKIAWDFEQFGKMVRGEKLPGHVIDTTEVSYANCERAGGVYGSGDVSRYDRPKWMLDLATKLFGESPVFTSSHACLHSRDDKRSQVPIRESDRKSAEGERVTSHLPEPPKKMCQSLPSADYESETPQVGTPETVLHTGSSENWKCEESGSKKGISLHGLPEFAAADTEGSIEVPWSLQLATKPGEGLVLRKPPFHPIELPFVIGHHMIHDLPVMAVMGIAIKRFRDTMIMAALLGTEPQSLKALARRWCGMKMREYSDVVAPAARDMALVYLSKVVDYANTLPKPVPKPKRSKKAAA